MLQSNHVLELKLSRRTSDSVVRAMAKENHRLSMGVEFRRRDYGAEERVYSLPRRRADTHPLSALSPSALQVKESGCRKDDFVDPLRATDGIMEESSSNILHEDIASEATAPSDISAQLRVRKEWSSFKKILMQRFPVSKITPVSVVSGVLAKGTKGELDDSKDFDEEDVKVVSQQDCLSKLQELKDEINQSWLRDDRVTSLRLSIKVARLLMDASVIQFYPTLFVLATDILDMLGDLVWARIKQKAEITEEGDLFALYQVCHKVIDFSVVFGLIALIFFSCSPLCVSVARACALTTNILVYDVGYEPVPEKVVNQPFQERMEYAVPMTSSVINFDFITISSCNNFKAGDVCIDGKETCNNWLSKVGSVRELLPRIYLELAILPCWRFLHNHPENNLQRLVMMVRGIADPLASAYCRLYLVQCAQRLPQYDTGFLITCINDLKVLLMRLTQARDAMDGNSKLLLTLIEPTIEYIMRCLFKDRKQQMEISTILVALGMGRDQSTLFENCSCLSIFLHYILKELPIGYTCCNAMEILHLIECTDDSSFDQCLNFKLLGHRLCERVPELSSVHLLVDKITQVLSCYDKLDAYLMVADAYLDIILENQLGTCLNFILGGVFDRLMEEKIGENEMMILQSIFLKLLAHFANIQDILALNHFLDILDMLHGSSRNSVNMQLLSMATRQGHIQDPTVIEVLLEVAQALYDGLDFSNMRKDDYQHPARVISRFVYMVEYGTEVESHLRFLAQCRGAFVSISELQEMLVHSSNKLAVRALRHGNNSISFVKSCLAFNEVTIPAIPSVIRQFKLYLETAEVAILGGFISHVDGLINAAINCLQSVDSVDGVQTTEDVEGTISLICKLCGILVMVPGSLEQGGACIPKRVLSFLDSQPWVLPRMKTKVLCMVVFLSAALSQNQFLYHAISGKDNMVRTLDLTFKGAPSLPTGLLVVKVIGNFQLFYGVRSYHQELLSFTGGVLQDIVNIVMQEPSTAVRGKIALEACNCVASSFKMSDETLEACSKLVEIAKSCSPAGDKFLQSTLKFLDAHQFLM
ncbi:UNVERIFIED_CONTAM: VPS35 endosomal protein sorting factor-like [Sesamum radiatum]|uniref:VPS35 endosomal protein sorting factor-like n=1 Tax=Sesamum radiatum TaxID=300843 RepID=A0AAW2T4C5_SESRA